MVFYEPQKNNPGLMEKFEVTIIGAGIVGLALAARLAPKLKAELLLVEQQEGFGRETSSRNSEVVHAGIYYPENSLKARLCVSGCRRIYQLCRENDIAHQRIGKLMRLFQNQAKTAGTTIAFHTGITAIRPLHPGFRLECTGPDQDNFSFSSKIVINCAGLNAAHLSRSAGILTPTIHYAKGSYFSYSGPAPLSHLVYPAPPSGGHGLGIHATIDLGGRLRFGPDLEYCETPDYTVNADRRSHFAAAIRRYLPSLDENRLVPDMAGIRPRLQGPDDPFSDFIIREETPKTPGFINLLGIESPGLTAAPAIADEIAAMLDL